MQRSHDSRTARGSLGHGIAIAMHRASNPPERQAQPPAGSAVRMGIDGDALRHPVSGVGKYVLRLSQALEDRLVAETPPGTPHPCLFLYTRLPPERLALPSQRWVVRQEPSALWRWLPSFVWLRTRGAALARQDRLTHFWAGRTIGPELGPTVRSLATVHDLNHRLVPQTMERATRWSHRLWFDREVRRVDVLLANSAGTSARLLYWNGRAADMVVRPGVDESFRLLTEAERNAAAAMLMADHGIRPPYLLAVGTLEPRKNLRALFDAWNLLRSSGRLGAHQLVIVGARGWQDPGFAATLKASHADGVRLPGFIPERDLPAFYSLADVLVCPSSYEGFGMPVLEARACGTPVVVADVPELREAGGPDATVTSDANQAESLAASIVQARMRRAGGSDAQGKVPDCWRWQGRVDALLDALGTGSRP